MDPVSKLMPLMVTFVALVLAEHFFKARPKPSSPAAAKRALGHFIILLVGNLAVRLIVPIGLVGVALWADQIGLGLFNLLEMPLWLKIGLAWLLLDLAIWLQHIATHHVPFLWRLHRVHHSDQTMDVWTAFRFHPLELALSVLWKAAVIVGLGAPVVAVLMFEIGLSAAAMFNHANIKIPHWLDRPLRWLIATPSFHLIHHHPDPHYTNSHYGNVLSVWDHLAGLGGQGPSDQSQSDVRIGLDARPIDNGAVALLIAPFLRSNGSG